jgi:hypothetical protein
MTITSGGALNAMGGGTVMRTFMPACAMLGMGTTIANAKSIVPRSAFSNPVPPYKDIPFNPHRIHRALGGESSNPARFANDC